MSLDLSSLSTQYYLGITFSGVHHCSSNELGVSFIGADVIRDYCEDFNVDIAI